MSVVSICGAGERQVWNLQVAGQPEYFANGILVHNCVMAFVPHLGEHAPGAVRKWAGAQELAATGIGEEARGHKRMREIHEKAMQQLNDAPWDIDGFSPQDDREARATPRNNVRSWQ